MSEADWNRTIMSLPNAHFLQTDQWAQIKKEVGWDSFEMTWKDPLGQVVGAAKLLTRTIRPFGIGPRMTIGYIPRGPMLDWQNDELRNHALKEIEVYCRRQRLIFVKMDPELLVGSGIPGSADDEQNIRFQQVSDEITKRHWRRSDEQIQFKNTAVLNLDGTEEEWLGRMKQKARYNLRLAQRSGVVVRIASDEELSTLYQMYAQTAIRDGFIIREMEYYLSVWRLFIHAKMAVPLIAEVEGQVVAGLVLFHFGTRAWYFYGMSTNLHREKMPNYLLQWHAMRIAKELGCEVYDLWGAPDEFNPNDQMYGVFRFKDGLGAKVVRTAGAWDFVNKPILYFVYIKILPLFLSFTRRLRRQKLNNEIG